MRTIKNDRKRAELFRSMIDNHINGNLLDARKQLNSLSKIDLVRLTNKLRFYEGNYNLYVDVAGGGWLDFYQRK